MIRIRLKQNLLPVNVTNYMVSEKMITNSRATQPVNYHSIWKSVVLHLLPGLLALPVFTLLARPIQTAGFPSIMAWLITVLLINIPFELGYLLYQSKKSKGRLTLKGVI